MIPRPARDALHRQYGQILLTRGESAARAADHLLQAAHRDDPASLAGLDTAAARTLSGASQASAGRLDQAAAIAGDMLTTPLPACGRGPAAVRPVL